MASTHPMPYQSPLWDHLETIRSMRRARKTWEQVAAHIGTLQGKPIHHTTVYNFFKRYADRLRKTGRGQALGFEPLPGEATSVRPSPPVPAASPVAPAKAEQPEWEPVEDETKLSAKERKKRLLQQKANPTDAP